MRLARSRLVIIAALLAPACRTPAASPDGGAAGSSAAAAGTTGSAGTPPPPDAGAAAGTAGTAPPPTPCTLGKKYPRDVNIAADPDVIFADDFEAVAISQILARWSSSAYDTGMSLVPDVPAGSAGKTSIQITTVSPGNQGADLFKRFANTNLIYFRYYVKYAPGVAYHHAGGWIGGFNPARDYPLGTAGLIPTGKDFFSVGAEPADASLRFDMYTYWMHMRPIYGNLFVSDDAVKLTAGRWTCVEVMLKMNDPLDAYNGELELWIDGQEIIHLTEGAPRGTWNGGVFTRGANGMPFEGFQWRSDAALATNFVWLDVYVTDSPAGKMWFDDLVVARRYVGPLEAAGGGCP